MAFDFAAVTAPFRMQPGLRALAPGSAQLTPNRAGDRALAEKLGVLASQAGSALLAEPGFDAAPAIEALCEQALTEHPDALQRRDGGGLFAPLLGWGLRGDVPVGSGPPAIGACLAALPPAWRRAGLLSLAFAEDFAIVDGPSGRIPWLAVCLPSHWSPAEKVGRHFAEVHAPVADNRLLLSASEHLTRLVTGGQRWERFVWTITPVATLDMHPARVPALPWRTDLDADALVAMACFRTERQTFIPVTQAQQAVFTIRVDSQPLAEAVDSADHARALHAALASMSDAVLAYRHLSAARDRLLEWLARRAEALAP